MAIYEEHIKNIVSTSNLGCCVVLMDVASRAWNTEYNPKRFSPVIIRIKNTNSTALLFNNGRLVCLTGRSESYNQRTARKYARIIQKLGYGVTFSNYKIHNIVAACDVGFKICLYSLHAADLENCEFNPELFSGLKYKMHDPDLTLKVFTSGKVNMVGLNSTNDIPKAHDKMLKLLSMYKINK